MSDAPAVDEVGVIGQVACGIAVTEEPWTLDIDVIVVSVGAGFGELAKSVRNRFPDASWGSVKLRRITPERPHVLPLSGGPLGAGVRFAVLTSPHEGGGGGQVSLRSVGIATKSAIRMAGNAGSLAVGVPLLATGALGARPLPVAEIAVPAAIRGATDADVHRVVFLCMERETADAIRSVLTRQPTIIVNGRLSQQFDIHESPDPRIRSGRSVEAPALRFSETELAGGVSSDLVDPNKGIPLSHDRMGVAPYVSMLATVIADRRTPLPLSIGVFGEWGAGKSYFMGLLRDQVRKLEDSANPAYCRHIEQIGFNAWHYADSNLWASLGDEIFRQLAESDKTVAEQREMLRTKLAARLSQRRCLEVATEQARIEVAALQASVDLAVVDQDVGARELVAALRDSGKLGSIAESVWNRLGVNDIAEQGKLLVELFRGTLSEADALRRAPWNRRGKLALVAAAVVLLVGGLAAALVPAAPWLTGVGGVLAALTTGGTAAMTAARSGLRRLRELTEDLQARLTQPSEDSGLPPDIAEKLDALRRAEAKQRVAEAQLGEVVSQVGELGRQLAELSPGRRLYSFLVERAGGDSYTRNLGLISTIRKDFQQLVELMKDWKENGSGDDADQPVERIVLYIDDLDRCPPRLVVEVLQAVHLLLALELFVVVVGVDPRWLLRALSSHYDGILSDQTGTADTWQVTPEDYLEKILNIPIVLPGMSSGSLSQLLHSMVDDSATVVATPTFAPLSKPSDSDSSGSGSTTSEERSTKLSPQHPADSSAIPVEAGSEVDQQQDPQQLTRIPRPLTDQEIGLLGSLDLLVGTPREAKRLVNLYRMLRATRDLSEASQFLGGDYQAVIVLLGLLTAHARLLAQVLDTPPDLDAGLGGGLVHRSPETHWNAFVGEFEPVRSGQRWTNGIVGVLPDDEVRHWFRLYRGLSNITERITLNDLSVFQLWVPRIRRFSYVLSPTNGS